MTREKCYVLVPFKNGIWTTKDSEGCIKPDAHNDAHISLLDNGKYIEWEDDYNCGCCQGDEDDCCKTFRFLTKDEVMKKLKKYEKS